MGAFNQEKYLKLQSEKILERIEQSGDKLYLEFGGKLFDDYHAERILPGFHHGTKIKLLQTLKEKAELIICISAEAIHRDKIRADYGISYSDDVLRLIDEFRGLELEVNSIVITQYRNKLNIEKFKHKLEENGIRAYIHEFIEGYPTDIENLLSDNGYGKNAYIETTKPLIVVTGPGPCSGKLATCMSQLYHEYKNGKKAQYAKFETFPVWNLPLKHPINIAYEAATADLEDINMIDPFHLEAYEKVAVNYNRDIEIFPVVRNIMQRISGNLLYNSPTDMGVNMVGYCIEDDKQASNASKQEVIRRFYKAVCDFKKGNGTDKTVERLELLMNELNVKPEDRKVVEPAIEKSRNSNSPAVALELKTGEIIVGRTTEIMTASASTVLNAIKYIAGLNDKILLISETILKPILELKANISGNKDCLLDINDVLIALSVCAVTNPTVELAISKLPELSGVQAHSTYMFGETEENVYRNLKIVLTEEPNFSSNKLYIK